MNLLDYALAAGLIVANKVVTTFFSIEIPRAVIQTLIETKFPIRNQSSLWTFTLCEPQVRLSEDGGKTGVELTLRLELMGGLYKEWRGLLEGRVDYRRTTGEFYLRDLVIRPIEPESRPDRYIGSLLVVAEAVLGKVFSATPIYRLEPTRFRHMLARLLIKSIAVRQDRLVLELTLY